jgi:peptidyl-prolyl cis-trans isomerase A (cyclophilin A)
MTRHPRERSDSRICFQLATSMLLAAITACAQKAPAAEKVAQPAPDSFNVVFQTSKGNFTVHVNRAWAPIGTDRFYALVNDHFFDDNRFFRVVPDFVVQWGFNGDPKRNEPWDDPRINDDSVTQTNARGTIVFATEGPNTRSHQFFINLRDNARLDKMGFAPFGKVVDGMNVVDSLYNEYGDDPDQHFIQTMGNSYLARLFPKLDYIKAARVDTTRRATP